MSGLEATSPVPPAPKNTGGMVVRVLILVAAVGAMAWAGLSLMDRGPSQSWLKQLRDGDEEGRRIAATNLNSPDTPPAVAIPVLCDALAGDRSAEVRFEIARILGAMGDAAIRRGDLPMLNRVLNAEIAAFKDESPSVRSIALTMIRVLSDATEPAEDDPQPRLAIPDQAKLVAQIIEALPDPEENVRIVALIALNCFPDQLDPAIPSLIKMARTDDPANKGQIQKRASSALKKAKPSKATVPMILELLKSPEPNIRFLAAAVLGQAGPEAVDAVPALIELLKAPAAANDREDPARPAANALGAIAPGTPRADEALTALKEAKLAQIGGRARAIDTAIGKFEPKKTP